MRVPEPVAPSRASALPDSRAATGKSRRAAPILSRFVGTRAHLLLFSADRVPRLRHRTCYASERVAHRSRTDLLVLTLLCTMAAAFAGRGLFDERQISMDGDMPRYLMNGVFVADFVRALPLATPLEYTREYFARYPALTLGHHPILPAVLAAPFYLVFGVSVFSARLSVLAALVVALVCFFRFTRDQYDTPTAAVATLLLAAIPGVTSLYRVVLSEPYTLTLVIVALYLMHRYTVTQRESYGWAFAITAVLSVWAKQLAVFMAPVYAFQYVAAFGIGALFRRRTIVALGVMGLCLVPLAALTLQFSSFNTAMATASGQDTPGRLSTWNLLRFGRRFWSGQFAVPIPLLVLSALGAVRALASRDLRVALPLVWIVSIYAAVVGLGVDNDRFVCYWLPAFALLSATTLQAFPSPRPRGFALAALLTTCGWIGWTGYRLERAAPDSILVRPIHVDAYEEAARLVSSKRVGDTVLYSAGVDTGYFVFFARKHDPQLETVVLRADKILTTSRMRRLDFERRVQNVSEIPALMKRYGVGYVVMEDRDYPEGPLRWLQEVVATPDFALVVRLPINTTDRRLRGQTVSIYEFKARQAGDPDADLSLGVPLMNDQISVKLGDLVNPPTGR
jgi:hypothetical protein